MELLIHDPLANVLKKYAQDVPLGGRSPGRSLNKDEFIGDLDRLQQRNTKRFYLILAVLVLGFATVLAFSSASASSIQAQYLLGGGGIFSGGFGALLLQLNRTWWRTDTLITVAKYSSPETLALIVPAMLGAESDRVPARRKS
jgi:hypothetical protein